MVPARFCARVFISDSRYAKEDERYRQYGKSLLAKPRLANVEFQPKVLCTESHPVDSFRLVLEAAKKTIVCKRLYTNYRKNKFCVLSKAGIHATAFFFYQKALSDQSFVSSESIE